VVKCDIFVLKVISVTIRQLGSARHAMNPMRCMAGPEFNAGQSAICLVRIEDQWGIKSLMENI
jgi:hypothetical protein